MLHGCGGAKFKGQPAANLTWRSYAVSARDRSPMTCTKGPPAARLSYPKPNKCGTCEWLIGRFLEKCIRRAVASDLPWFDSLFIY